MSETIYAILAVTLWNIIIFMIYGIDKRRAVKGKRRISEKALLLCAFHMNKEHWNTVYPNGDVPDKAIFEMINHSFDLIKPKVGKMKNG